MLFDTHAHFDDEQFDTDRDEVLKSLKSYGVGNIVNIGSSMKTSRTSVALAEKYDFVYATVGVHPSETGELCEADIEELKRLAANPKVRAIGEIGLTGELRSCDYLENRIAEAEKLGFKRCLIPPYNREKLAKFKKIQIKSYHNIRDVIPDIL